MTSEAEERDQSQATVASSETESLSSAGDDKAKLRVSLASHPPHRTVKGASLTLQRLGALLLKRVFHFVRNWRMVFSTLILPLLAFLCAMGLAMLRPTQPDMRSLLMTPALYTKTSTHAFAFFQ
jgi:hypothetical protein